MKEKERNIIAGEAETNETKCKRKKERKERRNREILVVSSNKNKQIT